jgi:hypothetical protein
MAPDPAPREPEARRRRAAGAAAALLLVPLAAYGVYLFRHAASGVGGSDSSGYANAARRLAAGTLVSRPRCLDRLGLPDALAFVCIPLGFVRGPSPGTMAPLYPVGFPAHLAAAAGLTGSESAIFAVSPIAALGCLVLVYLVGRDLGLPRLLSAGSAAVLAAWPTFLFQALQPMSDVVAAFWCTAAILGARRARRRAPWAALAGTAFGIAVLVRPTCVLLLPALALALPLRRAPLLAFFAGAVPTALLLAAYDVKTYGSPSASGYAKIGLWRELAFANFPARARHYSLWILRTLTPLVPLGWLVLPAARRPPGRDRAILIVWFGAFLLFHCLYGPYDSFLFVRFLLPGIPALILGAALAAWSLAPPRFPRPAAAAAGALLLAAVLLVESGVSRRVGITGIVSGESAAYRDACRWAEAVLPEKSVVLAVNTTGALEYYTNLTSVLWNLSAVDLARVRAHAEARGYGLFALIFPSEEGPMARQASGPWVRVGESRGIGLWRLSPGPGVNEPGPGAAAPSSRRRPPPP